LGAELWIAGTIWAALFHGQIGLIASGLVLILLLLVMNIMPRLIPLQEASFESYTWGMGRALLLSTFVTLILVGLLVWTTSGHA
jgi:hypothetical protein